MAKKSTVEPKLAVEVSIYTPTAPPYVNYVRKSGTLTKTKQGTICVVGRAVNEGLELISVWAKIYRRENEIPNKRPNDAQQGTVLVNGYFDFTGDKEVSGAKCKDSGAATNNWLAVWVVFPDGEVGPYKRPFHGQCNPEYCECDRPSDSFKKRTVKKTAKKTAKKKAAKKKTKHG